MSIRLKRPGICVICGTNINPAIVKINPAVDICSHKCSAACQRLSVADRIKMIREKFEASPELEEVIAHLEHQAKMLEGMERMMKDLMGPEEPAEDYMRPMGVEPPKPSPVFKPMKPSSSIFIAGETDEEVAQHVLMVCWGTAAK